MEIRITCGEAPEQFLDTSREQEREIDSGRDYDRNRK